MNLSSRSFDEAMALSGRVTDPAIAPMVPVYIEINGYPGGVDVQVSGWSRAKDKILEFRFHVQGENLGEIIERPLDLNDAIWLKNIGARP